MQDNSLFARATAYPHAIDGPQVDDTAGIAFEKLSPLVDTLPDVPKFDYSMLPEAFVGYVANTSERMDNSAPDYVAISCMVRI